jgi:hypothetical protein
MRGSQSSNSIGGNAMKSSSLIRLAVPFFAVIFVFLVPPLSQSQANPQSPAAQSGCPVEIQHFNPSGVSVKVKNVSGRQIVGLVFNAALADATEHWKWLHWDFDTNRSLRDFSWNKAIPKDAVKNLSWDGANLNYLHGGGGAFVLASVLFDDGSSWEDSPDSADCKVLWYNSHKKAFFKPVLLPYRE